ncbi:hypothetical protein VaNZ11_016357 [Volvox africanus]|uniref:DNA-directed RNA polymerase III subunit n=1 Tax=Volvox africanus TaxID=51714 RepID=A0ABQ5SNN8_9CHLO|nr:hypothetical protein VaNZ11_016357 [Volvox africanus]
MSGRGGGRGGFGRGGGRGGFGGRGAPIGPVARDEDGTVLATAPAGPPPLFPEVELPEHPEITSRDKMLLLRRFELTHRSKTSPYFLELPQAHQDTGTLEEGFDPYRAPQPGKDGSAGGGHGSGTKRARPPLSSVMTLLAEYFPEELYSSKDMRASRLQTLRGQDAYFRAQSRPDDPSGLRRLEHLAKLESLGEEGGEGGPGTRKTLGGEGDEEEAAAEEELRDTDEEEDMEDDDYYQGEHFDDDEGYGDALDDGGDEGPVY